MSSVRRVGLPTAGLATSAGVATVVVIVEAMPIDLLMNMGAFALFGLSGIAAIGWLALQRQSTVSGEVFDVEHDRHSE
jgi:hypothetical protein